MLVHFYKLDPSPGVDFSKMVRSLHGLPVTSSSPDDARGFWVIAFFARSKLKLDETNVGLILQSVLGGFATDFAVVEVKDWIFKFTVSSGEVIYNLGIISDASFKVSFHPWNEHNLHLAESFVSASLEINFH